MLKPQAKKLKAGQRVIWKSLGGSIRGTVTKKAYTTIWIKWDDGAEQKHFADTMDCVELLLDRPKREK